MTPSPLFGLDSRVRRWVDYEQTVNERMVDASRFHAIATGSDGVRAASPTATNVASIPASQPISPDRFGVL